MVKVILTLKDDSRRMECVEDPKTFRLLLLSAATVVVTAVILLCDFIRELAILVDICVLSHCRKMEPQRSRMAQMFTWLSVRETITLNDYCEQCATHFND